MPRADWGTHDGERHWRQRRYDEYGVPIPSHRAPRGYAPEGYCECDCGEQVPEGKTWRKGHAVRLRHTLARLAAEGNIDAIDRLTFYGWRIPPEKENPRFGIELEFWGLADWRAAQALSVAGYASEAEEYNHRDRPYWKIVTDGSVHAEGLELVSPILEKPGDLTVSSGAIQALADAGAQVDNSCGLHVHHSAMHLQPGQIASVVEHYALFQDVIHRLFPESRQHTQYCSPQIGTEGWIREVREQSNVHQLKRRAGGWHRYVPVNVASMYSHGTLEFRQHPATLSATKATAWVRFTDLFMEKAKTAHASEAYGAFGGNIEDASVRDMCSYLGADVDLSVYMQCRENIVRQGGDEDDIKAAGDAGYRWEPEENREGYHEEDMCDGCEDCCPEDPDY